MRTPRTALMLLASAALVVTTACGGDDDSSAGSGGGGGGSPLSDDAFCARIEAIQDEADAVSDVEEADAMFFDGLRELQASAPNPEVRDAIGTFVDFLDEIEGLDEDDPEAFERMFELAQSPDFLEASEVLEDYSVNTCGFDE